MVIVVFQLNRLLEQSGGDAFAGSQLRAPTSTWVRFGHGGGFQASC